MNSAAIVVVSFFIFVSVFNNCVNLNVLHNYVSLSTEIIYADYCLPLQQVSFSIFGSIFGSFEKEVDCFSIHKKNRRIQFLSLEIPPVSIYEPTQSPLISRKPTPTDTSTPMAHSKQNHPSGTIPSPLFSRNPTPPLANAPMNSFTPSPSKPHYTLILLLTVEGKKLAFYQKNTLDLLSIYQSEYSFKAVLFTRSPCYKNHAFSRDIEVISYYQTNKYDLPVLKAMLDTVGANYSYDYIGYLNSDILIHPGLFSVLDTVSDAVKGGLFPSSFVLASRVANADSKRPIRVHCRFKLNCLRAFSKLQKNSKMRTPTSADVFIFSREFPLDALPPLVVGRRYIDYIITTLPFTLRNSALIDITNANLNIHQGFDNYRSHIKDKFNSDNDVYNRQFVIKPVKTCVDSHFKICQNNVITNQTCIITF